MDTITISNKEIALMAFYRLRKEDKTDSALETRPVYAAWHKHIPWYR